VLQQILGKLKLYAIGQMFSTAFQFACGLLGHSGHWAVNIYTFVMGISMSTSQPKTTDRI